MTDAAAEHRDIWWTSPVTISPLKCCTTIDINKQWHRASSASQSGQLISLDDTTNTCPWSLHKVVINYAANVGTVRKSIVKMANGQPPDCNSNALTISLSHHNKISSTRLTMNSSSCSIFMSKTSRVKNYVITRRRLHRIRWYLDYSGLIFSFLLPCCKGNKLHSVYPSVGSVTRNKSMSR